MHTVDQKEYGEANLGTKGMALFFSSHVCGPLCEAIGELVDACWLLWLHVSKLVLCTMMKIVSVNTCTHALV